MNGDQRQGTTSEHSVLLSLSEAFSERSDLKKILDN